MSEPTETIARTPNPLCPACDTNKRHTAEEWKAFHPDAGYGHSRAHGAPKAEETAAE